MASFNKAIVCGNLTRDIELRYTASGLAVCDLSLAVNDRRKNAAGEWVEESTFIDITLFGKTAEVAGQYLARGSNVLIEGRLKLEQWESKDGQKRSKLKVVCETMQMLGGKPRGEHDQRRQAVEHHEHEQAPRKSSPQEMTEEAGEFF